MDYEKKYKEALERAKHYQKENGSAVISAIFPELKESEDERLRKTTIAFLKEQADKGYENAVECIDWLENQGQCEHQAKDFEEFINKLSKQFSEVSFGKLSRIAVRVKKYLEQCNLSNAQSKDVWHDADETPVVSNRQILVIFKDSDPMVTLAEDWESLERQLKWAYINDLIK